VRFGPVICALVALPPSSGRGDLGREPTVGKAVPECARCPQRPGPHLRMPRRPAPYRSFPPPSRIRRHDPGSSRAVLDHTRVLVETCWPFLDLSERSAPSPRSPRQHACSPFRMPISTPARDKRIASLRHPQPGHMTVLREQMLAPPRTMTTYQNKIDSSLLWLQAYDCILFYSSYFCFFTSYCLC